MQFWTRGEVGFLLLVQLVFDIDLEDTTLIEEVVHGQFLFGGDV